MTAKKKPPFHHGNLKQALLDASLDILDGAGPDAITIREVARRAGVSHAAPVNHFKDRGALLTEVAVILFEELSGQIAETLARTSGSLRDRIKAFADGLIAYGLRNPNRYRMLWRRDLIDTQNARLAEVMDVIYDQLMIEISKTSDQKNFDDHTVAIGLWSMAHGYTALRLDGTFEAADDEVTGQPRQEAMLTAFIEILAADE